MASQRIPFVTPEEYLASERNAETRSEYRDGVVYPVQGATPNHAKITVNVGAVLLSAMKSRDCSVYVSSLLVKASSAFTYPDVVVTCGEESFVERTALLNPTLIVEVLSDSTEDYDRAGKFRQYRRIPSLQEYVTVSQDEPFLEQYVLQNGHWVLTEHQDPFASVALVSVNVDLPVADVYAKVQWPREQA